jgi:hypothetical protein
VRLIVSPSGIAGRIPPPILASPGAIFGPLNFMEEGHAIAGKALTTSQWNFKKKL